MKQIFLALFTLALAASAAFAQVEVVSIEKADLGPDQEWGYARFSPDGALLYVTNLEFDGIWEYSLATRQVRQLTGDPKSGYGFSISADGQQIAYRRTFYNDRTYERTQELVILRTSDGASEVVASRRSLSVPAFAGNALMYAEQPVTETLQKSALPAGPVLLGTEKTKIAMLIGGTKQLLDPLGNGRYIWPSLSADAKNLVAYAMEGGSFVYGLESGNVTRIGRRNAGVWTRSGNWIVYMDDRDDGHRVLSSEIMCVRPDGSQTLQLTSTPEAIEMYPQCSPVEDLITFHTAAGEIFLLTYREVTP